MIQYVAVSKKYSDSIVAVEDVSFEVAEGEFVFLVGPSGSGKTTLIRMLIREEVPSEGKIFFHDQDITKLSQSQVYKLRRKVGVIFQDFKLIPELNAYENIAFAMEVAGRSEKEIKDHVPYLLDIVGLSHRTDFFPRMLSGGEQQRVAIARAIANNPKVLIADEPTGNLDPESAWDVVQILTKINNWGTTIIMSTHGSDIVNTLNKRVIKMTNGKMVMDVMNGQYDQSGVVIPAPIVIETTQKPIEVAISDETVTISEKPSSESEQVETIDEQAPEPVVIQPEQKIEEVVEEKEVTEPKKEKKIKFSKKGKSSKKSIENKVLSSLENAAEQTEDFYSRPIDELKLSTRLWKILDNNGIKTIGDIMDAGIENVAKFDKVSKKDVGIIETKLGEFK